MDENIDEGKGFTENDIGEILTLKTVKGTSFDERIVQVHCHICAASFIGPIREAGGFVAGHDAYHRWEANRAMSADSGLSA